MGEQKKRRSVLRTMFFYIFLGITLFTAYLIFSTWREIKNDRLADLNYTAGVIKSYYELTFRQWELTLTSVGKRISEITGPNKAAERLAYAKEALSYYDELLAFGYAETDGQISTFTGLASNDSLPNLRLSPNSRRSFDLVNEKSGIVIGESYYFPNVNDWILPVRVPIVNEDSVMVAVNTTAIDYSGLHRALASFRFNEHYRVHLINKYFNVNQVYFPLETTEFGDILKKEANIYLDKEIISEADEMIRFSANNQFEGHKVYGVQTPLSGLNHDLVVHVSTSIVWSEFYTKLAYILGVYGVLMVLAVALYKYFNLKERSYFKELQESRRRLEEYNKNLEMTVAARTIELEHKNKALTEGNTELQEALKELQNAQQRLIQSEKMASLGIMAAGVGHEINNPLNFIRGGINVLEEKCKHLGGLDEESAKLFKVVEEGIDRITKIVHSLSHYSKPSESLDETCEVPGIIQNCLLILNIKLKGRVNVKGNLDGQFRPVQGNEGKLHQLFLNLISNAEQAINGHGNIEVKIRENNEALHVTISDDGEGISQENIHKIADPFFTTKGPGVGTGLGLFIVHSIINEHNGEIRFESEEGKGTSVHVHLPFEQSALS